MDSDTTVRPARRPVTRARLLPPWSLAVLVMVLVASSAGCSSLDHSAARHAPSTPRSIIPTSTIPVTTTGAATTAVATTAVATTAVATAPADGVPAGAAPAPGSCHVRGQGAYVLPDPACTPGATNPDVTANDISSTICASGWTATVRPSESYTEALKTSQLLEYSEAGPLRDYEEDHLIPLELGGSPASAQNLWPEPGSSPNTKDSVEDAARRAVCAGRLTLAQAQEGIAVDWVSLGEQLGVVKA